MTVAPNVMPLFDFYGNYNIKNNLSFKKHLGVYLFIGNIVNVLRQSICVISLMSMQLFLSSLYDEKMDLAVERKFT